MEKITSELAGVKTAAIAGHVRPDGDCVGSCMGLYLYLKENYPEIEADVYLEEVKEGFSFLNSIHEVKKELDENKIYDVLFILDTSVKDRVGVVGAALDTAKKTICVDHHVSNKGFADIDLIRPTASSASELLETGINFSKIVDQAFYEKTYVQNQILGRCLMESILVLDGKCIIGSLRQKDMEFYHVTPKDLDGIVQQLRVTKGVEVAIFLYEIKSQEFKVSLRSNGRVDVNEVASYFGGGGHVLAAGCTLCGSVYDAMNNLLRAIEKQLLKDAN